MTLNSFITREFAEQISTDRVIGLLAGRQHGVVARYQLLAIGIGEDAIDYRLNQGRLYRIHQGVYAVGHLALTQASYFMAAVLACGEDSFLSHGTAAYVWGIFDWAPERHEVTVTRHNAPQIAALRTRTARLGPGETVVRNGIPVTSYPRVFLDLAASVTDERLALAFEHAEQRSHELRRIARLVEHRRGRRGTRALNRLLSRHATTTGISRSEFEKLFLRWLDQHGLPRPDEVNGLMGTDEGPTYMPDCTWRAARVIVELETWVYHGTPSARARDSSRDIDLQNAGWKAFRVTPDMLEGKAGRKLAAQLRRALGTAAA